MQVSSLAFEWQSTQQQHEQTIYDVAMGALDAASQL
jgi:hypothetical protein